jgi:hypothetical protein
MGYSTDIEGKLFFTHELSVPQIKRLNEYFGEDGRDKPEWDFTKGKIAYIQWELTKDMDGIEWDGNEKFYEIVNSVNFIIHNMRKEWPEFGLKGELLCQGEDLTDRWHLKIGADGFAYREDSNVKTLKCPECDHVWEAA